MASSVTALSLLADLTDDIVYIGNGYICFSVKIQTDHISSVQGQSGCQSGLENRPPTSVKSCAVEQAPHEHVGEIKTNT